LSEIAPTKIKGAIGVFSNLIVHCNLRERQIGVLTQLAIVLGLLITQSVGLWLSAPTQWRLVLLLSSCLAISQLLVSPLVCESPAWLGRRGLLDEQKSVSRKLWGTNNIMHTDGESSLRLYAVI
jgi:MFS transporter, SP family, solute carrier family 2 (facilitated glucose transporter), member 3